MVYVDTMLACTRSKAWRFDESCHMMADTIDELHQMAQMIGLKRQWFQNKPGFPHYDLTASRRRLAVKEGARQVDRKELITIMNRLRAAAQAQFETYDSGLFPYGKPDDGGERP